MHQLLHDMFVLSIPVAEKIIRPIIVYGVLGDALGRPVAVQVYPGDTGDPSTVPDQVTKLSQQFGLSQVVLVGDRGTTSVGQR
jgi:transposase